MANSLNTSNQLRPDFSGFMAKPAWDLQTGDASKKATGKPVASFDLIEILSPLSG